MKRKRFTIAAKTDIGNIKKINQDNLLCKSGKVENNEFGLFIVCDGVGGLSKGEIASTSVIEHFDSWCNNELIELLSNNLIDSNTIKNSICNNLYKVNQNLISFSNEQNIKLGTTTTILFVLNKKYYIAHIGDSRVYIVNKKLKQLTEDHTYYAKLMKEGNIEKARKTKKSILTQCIGVKDHINIYLSEGNLNKNSTFILCSDGFYNKLDKKITKKICKLKKKNQKKLKKHCDKLVDNIKAKGERDNITLIAVNVSIKKDKLINKIKMKFLGGKK